MFIPILLYAGSLYYSHRIAGLLATTFLGGVILEGRIAAFDFGIEKRKNDRNYTLGLNPRYEEYLVEKKKRALKLFGVPEADLERLLQANPPGIQYIPFELTENDLPPNQKYLVGKWLLTAQEEAQFSDMRKRDNLNLASGEGAKFFELCKEHGVDPNQMALLTWPKSDGITVDIGWLMNVSKARLSDQEFLLNLRGEEAKS